jgi:hypothetical protein
MNSTNNASARMSYDVAKQILFNSWIESFGGNSTECWRWVNNRKLSQHEIRLEVELNINNNRFAFGLTPNQANSTGVVFNTENRLMLQDSLIVSEYAVFVAQPTSQTDTAYLLNTYGNTQVFAAADAAALDSTFYSNGSLQTKVNGDVVIPYRGLFNHWYKPQTQQTAALGAGAPKDQLRGAEDGFITQEPNLLLIGSKNYVPEIVLPSALASAAAFLRAILIYRGVLAQNSTVVN